MSVLRVRLPNSWEPRRYQLPLWSYLERGGKRAAAVWHRRAGKDDVALHWTAVAANDVGHRGAIGRIGNYWHMLPAQNQARRALWTAINPHTGTRRIDEAFPLAIRDATLEDEMLIRFKCGSTWQLVGSDNYNSLVGSPPIGLVFSEYALAKPQAWDYLRPILAENGGWALFIYTSRGRNHGADLFEVAKGNPAWFAERLTVDDTKAISAEVIEEERRSGMTEAMIQQEYYCSFDSAVVGSYYGDIIAKLDADKRIGPVPYDPSGLVTTAWDLGYGDDTAIWFAQIIGAEVRIIDYYENRGVGLDHYAKVIREKPYIYHRHLLPHDGAKGELIAGTTIVAHAKSLLGDRSVEILPRIDVADGINAARVLLPKCRFDADKCAQGLKALRLYRRHYDEDRKVFSDRPFHDWTSHAADGFRYLAMGLAEPRTKKPKINREPAGAGGWMG